MGQERSVKAERMKKRFLAEVEAENARGGKRPLPQVIRHRGMVNLSPMRSPVFLRSPESPFLRFSIPPRGANAPGQ